MACMGAGGVWEIWEISVSSSEFYCDPKTALKSLKKKN